MSETQTAAQDELMSMEERKKRWAERRRRRRVRLDRSLSTSLVRIFFGVVFGIALFLLFFPRPKTSNIEKRDLATFPSFSMQSYFSGEYTYGITQFYDDTIPFRDSLKNLNNNMKKFFGLHTASDIEVVGTVAKVEPEPETTAGETETAAAPAAAETEDEMPVVNNAAEATFDDGFLIVNENDHWRGLPLFGGGDCHDVAEFLNNVRGWLPDTVNMYAMPIPLASEYYLPDEYSDYSASQSKAIESLFGYLNDGITKINLIQPLGMHADEDIFLRTDHHWTALGTYYACRELAEAAGVPYADISEYNKVERPGYVGSLYGLTQSSNLLNDPEIFTYYVPAAPYIAAYHDPDYYYDYWDDIFVKTDCANSYLLFIGGDSEIVHVKTAVNNGRKIMVFKDSYGNPMTAFLTSSFEDIYICDYRYFDVNLVEFVLDQGITDFVYACDVYSAADVSTDYSRYINQNAGIGIPDDEPDLQVPSGPGSEFYTETAAGQDPYLVGDNVSYSDVPAEEEEDTGTDGTGTDEAGTDEAGTDENYDDTGYYEEEG